MKNFGSLVLGIAAGFFTILLITAVVILVNSKISI